MWGGGGGGGGGKLTTEGNCAVLGRNILKRPKQRIARIALTVRYLGNFQVNHTSHKFDVKILATIVNILI